MVIVTDSNNLIEALRSPHPAQEKRLRVDIAALKQDVQEGAIQVKHCPGSRQVVDILTKSGASPDLIRRVISSGSLRNELDSLA